MGIHYTDKHKIPFEVDDEDDEMVSLFTWHIQDGYPKCKILGMSVHLFLLGPAPKGLEWDHKDRNKLNNRKLNLRSVTRRIQRLNENLRSDNTSGMRGIHRNGDWWRATLTTETNYYYLGQYKTKEEAFNARLAKEDEIKRQSESL